jgi:hypothetical protein
LAHQGTFHLASGVRPGYLEGGPNVASEVRPMKEINVIAAILTVGFYSGRGSAMNLPQIIATYNEMRAMLTEQMTPKKKKKA